MGGYHDLLDMHGIPGDSDDRSLDIFFDQGAWHGYSLPPRGDTATGFIGPFVHSLGQGQWAGLRVGEVDLRDATTHQPIELLAVASHSAPGYLVRRFHAPGLTVRERLFFVDSWHALVEVTLTATHARVLDLAIEGRLLPGQTFALARHEHGVVETLGDSGQMLRTRLHANDQGAAKVTLSNSRYRIALGKPMHLDAHQSRVIHVVQTLVIDPEAVRSLPAIDYAAAWTNNRKRWTGYLAAAASSHLAGLPDELARRVGAKAIVTLLDNWRAPRGDILHAGVVPSYSNPDFNGFWAWDSWKHAAALADFAPKLARNQIRAMFDYQAANGMVPDCIFRDKADNNWRDTKPPLATWAVWKVYVATGDKAFLREMYPRLVRYHEWWYADRDHDHDHLAEYGSTDGTRIAAKWESGMDNAVRFDHIRMLKNHSGAWSMDQASADLNAYLYGEARALARMAGILGMHEDRARWQRQARHIRTAVQERMFDPSAGWFFDRRLGQGKRVAVYGSDGWIPLWTGLASKRQAQAVEHTMLDPDKFATLMPLPTLARDDPHFEPKTGYWRGPVWLDQALFGVQALRRYGYRRQADALARRLVVNAKGLTEQAPMYENYDPLTGAGYQSRNFSWTAAAYLLLLHAGTERGR